MLLVLQSTRTCRTKFFVSLSPGSSWMNEWSQGKSCVSRMAWQEDTLKCSIGSRVTDSYCLCHGNSDELAHVCASQNLQGLAVCAEDAKAALPTSSL